jgi:hypothetical protein
MRAAVTLLLVVLGGCSFVATSRHPHTNARGERDCDTYGMPVIDAAVAVATLAVGSFAIFEDQTTPQRDGWNGVGTVYGGAIIAAGLPWTIGAIVGTRRVGACRRQLRGPYTGSAAPAS